MRIKRTRKNYGSGSGKKLFNSDMFRVTLWYHQKDSLRTVIECKLFPDFRNEICFDGNHSELTSDALCMEQFTGREILRMIKYQKIESFKEGKSAKAEEILTCLYVRQ